MARLVLIRHAPVLEKGRCYGRIDLPTVSANDRIDELAALVADGLSPGSKPRLLHSPAERCREVAFALGKRLNLRPTCEERLQEISMGSWEGERFTQLETLPEFAHWMANWKTSAPPGGESLADLERRVHDWLHELQAQHYVIIAHAGIVRALRTMLFGQSWDEAMSEPVLHLHPYSFETEGAL